MVTTGSEGNDNRSLRRLSMLTYNKPAKEWDPAVPMVKVLHPSMGLITYLDPEA